MGPLLRPARASLCILLAAALTLQNAWALGPFEKNHPLVEKGAQAYADGKYSDALDAFDEARRQLAGNAAIDLNRGNTLYRMGRYEDARDAFLAAQKTEDPKLQQRVNYNLGNTYAQLQQRDEAIRAYRKALRQDPFDKDARHNLETLLRNTPPPQPPQDGGTDGGSNPDAGADGGQNDGGQTQDGGQPQAGDGGQSGGDGGSPDGGSQGGANQGDGGMDGGMASLLDAGIEPMSEGDGGVPKGMSREEAVRMLDAMKQNEKNLQLWKFQQKRPRKAHDKDW